MAKLSVKAKHASPKASRSPASRSQLKVIDQIPAEQREHMIAEAAYYLAEHRGFQGGDPMQDWLQAEVEIDHRLLGTPLH
jgi:hypothetical protein